MGGDPVRRWLLLAVLGMAPAGPVAAQSPELSGAAVDLDALRTDTRRGYPAVALEELGRHGYMEVAARGGVISAVLNGAPLQLYLEAPFVRLGGEVHPIGNPAYRAGAEYWVPAELITDWSARGLSGGSPAAGRGDGGPDPEIVSEVAEARTGPMRPLRVMIDAGHGGRDPGTIGRRGTREKDVVLAIARLVHAELSARPGIEPLLTRDRDVLVPLRRRSQLAVAQEADLFVSIHANASRNRDAQGFETYFLGEARTELSREVAMRENSAVQYEEEGDAPRPDEIQFILAQLNLASFLRESGLLGSYVQNSLRAVLRTEDRGVKQNVFWVLVGATGSMPSVLVEVGFLSNAAEERMLRGESGRRRIARAIADAITEYRDDYGPRLQAAGGQ